jgi:phosphotriesterase-related protein
MAQVNTVLGPVSSEALGITLMHEHVIFGYPGWYGDATIASFNKDEALNIAVSVLKELKDKHWLGTWEDATANECGRNARFLKEVSEKSGVNIVCSTGYYFEEEGAPAYFKFRSMLVDTAAEVYELMTKEVTKGIEDSGLKAGVIKLASGKGRISDYEKTFFKAAARVQKETGVPIITHTQEGTMGPEQINLLISEGADPSKVMIGHMSDNTDIRYQLSVLQKGTYVGFDRMGLQGIVGCPMDNERLACIIGLIGIGYGEKLMIAHDSILKWLGRPLGLPDPLMPFIQNWNPFHMFQNLIPALKKAGISEAQVETILVHTPTRLFEGRA